MLALDASHAESFNIAVILWDIELRNILSKDERKTLRRIMEERASESEELKAA